MGRARVLAVAAAAAALVLGLVAPATGATHVRKLPVASAVAKPACDTDATDFPSDGCVVSAFTNSSVTITWTTVPHYPSCGVASPPCQSQFFGQFSLSVVGPSVVTTAGSCPGADANRTWSGSADYIGDFDAETLTCSITWTWDPTTTFPLNAAINMTELDGDAITDSPAADHTFGVTFPTPGPHAAFTDVADKDEPGDYTFTDTSFSLVPHVTIASEKWTSSDGGHGTGRVWDHTFDKDGTYDVTLVVTDSSGKTAGTGKTDEVSHPVKVTTVGGGSGSGSSASITVKEKLSPTADAGRFDLIVGKKTVKAKAGDGDHGVAHVKAGHYVVSQLAQTIGLTNYGVSLSCTKNGSKDFTKKVFGATVSVSDGDAAVCTFTDKRSGMTHCDVPNLTGKSLRSAKKALARAHCRLGGVTKPRHPKHGAKLLVGHSSPAAYAVVANGKRVSLVLV
jgi:PKD domain